MKEIPLTQGKVAFVDDEDYEYLSQWKWCAHRHNRIFYAVRECIPKPTPKTIAMHRVIIGIRAGFQIDHIDGHGLNNQKSNLRFVTTRQNSHNRHPIHPKKSRYPGVFWREDTCRWRAIISINGKLKHLGHFDNELSAYNAYIAECTKIGCDIL